MKENVIPSVSSVVTMVAGVVSENVVVQWIMFVLGFLSFAVSIIYTLWKWYKSAKADGKISIDEIGELLSELDRVELPKDLHDKIKDLKNKGKE